MPVHEKQDDAFTNVWFRIVTRHPWDFLGLDWVQGGIWALTGFSENPAVESFVQVF